MFGNPLADRALGVIGIAVALLGETVRLLTIGFEYIHRGGKDGRVYAGRLVKGGVFGLVRNPMYIGNALIASGMTMYLGAPLGYLLVIPFFVRLSGVDRGGRSLFVEKIRQRICQLLRKGQSLCPSVGQYYGSVFWDVL